MMAADNSGLAAAVVAGLMSARASRGFYQFLNIRCASRRKAA